MKGNQGGGGTRRNEADHHGRLMARMAGILAGPPSSVSYEVLDG
jgi:hypothetical protein